MRSRHGIRTGARPSFEYFDPMNFEHPQLRLWQPLLYIIRYNP
jgi:hypothetical protein